MKVMHNPPLDVRLKVEEYLKNSRELVNFAYGSNDPEERRFYVGITYLPVNDNTAEVYSLNRYDVVTYDAEKDIFVCDYRHLNYENALFYMSKSIRKNTYENQ